MALARGGTTSSRQDPDLGRDGLDAPLDAARRLLQTMLDCLRLQFAGGLTMDEHPTVFTDEGAAREDAKNRLLVWRLALQIRLDRGVPEGEVVRVTLHDKDGTVLFEGDVG